MQKRIHKLYENKNSVHKLCKIFMKSYEVKILRHKILIEKKKEKACQDLHPGCQGHRGSLLLQCFCTAAHSRWPLPNRESALVHAKKGK